MFKINHFKVNLFILLAERIEILHGLLRFGFSVLLLRWTVPLTYKCIIFILFYCISLWWKYLQGLHSEPRCRTAWLRLCVKTLECEIPLTNTTCTLTLMPLQQGVRCQECFIINHTPLPHTPPLLMLPTGNKQQWRGMMFFCCCFSLASSSTRWWHHQLRLSRRARWRRSFLFLIIFHKPEIFFVYSMTLLTFYAQQGA